MDPISGILCTVPGPLVPTAKHDGLGCAGSPASLLYRELENSELLVYIEADSCFSDRSRWFNSDQFTIRVQGGCQDLPEQPRSPDHPVAWLGCLSPQRCLAISNVVHCDQFTDRKSNPAASWRHSAPGNAPAIGRIPSFACPRSAEYIALPG